MVETYTDLQSAQMLFVGVEVRASIVEKVLAEWVTLMLPEQVNILYLWLTGLGLAVGEEHLHRDPNVRGLAADIVRTDQNYVSGKVVLEGLRGEWKVGFEVAAVEETQPHSVGEYSDLGQSLAWLSTS